MEDLPLAHLGLHAPNILLRVMFYQSAITRAELTAATRFCCPLGRTILTLPLGTNVLGVMDTAGKIELRKELAK